MANLDFWGHVTYSGSFDIKSKISKICKFACSNPARVGNSLRFALSLTVSEISANLKFLNFFKILKFFEFFWNFWNVQKCFALIIDNPRITKFRPFRSISYGFWVLNLKFKNWFFLKWPPFGQFRPDFCQKIIGASFHYTGCSYNFKSFHLAVRPVQLSQTFF